MIRTSHSRFLCLVAALGGLIGSATAGQDTFSSADASYLVRITHNPSVIPLSEETLDALINSAGVRGVVFGQLTPDQREMLSLSFELVDQADDDVLIGHILLRDAPTNAARQILTAVCDRLRDALAQATEADAEYLKRRIERAHAELERAHGNYGALQAHENALCEKAGRSRLNRDVIAEEIADLREKRRDIQAEMVSVHAREQALGARIAEIAERIEQSAGKDEVLREIEQVLEIKEKELGYVRVMVENGQAMETEFLQALGETARIRAELAERRRQSQRMSGGELLEQLNAQLVEMSIHTAESDAMVAWIGEQLADIKERDLLELAAMYQREVELKMEIVWDSIRETSRELQNLERQLRSLREPQVLVIGGEAK